MAHKELGQWSLADHFVTRRARPKGLLERVNDLLDWKALAHLVDPLHAAPHGAPSYPPVVMLKVLLLGQWYGLSDPMTEDAVSDRVSFRQFCGLSLHDAVPDHSTIHRYRNLLGESGLDQAIFDEVNRQLDAMGLILREGTLIDASLIASAARPPAKPKEEKPAEGASAPAEPEAAGPSPAAATPEQRSPARPPSKLVRSKHDPDAAWTRKNGRYHFGYKFHVGVDKGSGLIRRVRFTAASVNDTVEADNLICGDEAAVYADAAYHTHARESRLKEQGIEPWLMRRGNKHHALSEEERARNKAIGKKRGPVEQVFGRAKTVYDWARARCVGLARNRTHGLTMSTAMNLKRMVVLCG